MLLSSLLLSPLALAATPIHSGELYDSAHTTEAQTTTIRIVNPSSYAVSDQLQLKSSLLGLLGGPNLGAELGLRSDEDSALSVELTGASTWLLGGLLGSLELNYTLGGLEEDRFNLSAGAGWTSLTELNASAVMVPVGVSYHLVPSQETVIQFYGEGDLMTLLDADRDASGALGFRWNRGWETFRLMLGVSLFMGETEVEYTSIEGGELDQFALDSPVVPLPTVGFWWRL